MEFDLSPEIGIALLGTGLGLGLRHGIDWDHIAAISDVTSSHKKTTDVAYSWARSTLSATPPLSSS